MEIEALKIIPQLVNPKSSANPHHDRIRKMSKQVTSSQHKNSYSSFYFLLLAALYIPIHPTKLSLLCIYFGSKGSLTEKFTEHLYLLICQ